jgi:hypothetical protein
MANSQAFSIFHLRFAIQDAFFSILLAIVGVAVMVVASLLTYTSM